MESNKKEIIKVLIIAGVFILIYFGLFIFDEQTGRITELAKSISSFVMD